MANENIANRKFVGLMKLQQMNGAIVKDFYKHHESVDDMQRAISDSITAEITEKLQKSAFVGLITDETVNVTVRKKLIVYFVALENGVKRTYFGGNYTIVNGTAETVTSALLTALEERGITTSKVMGFGSDGAAVMMGCKTGVAKRLKDQNPFMINIHCVAHRVALAASAAGKETEKITKYRQTVNSVYHYFEYSAVRYERLRELNSALDESDIVSLKEPCSVRWLSLTRAVKAIKANLPALLMELDEDAARGNAQAEGILRQIWQYSFVAMTYTLLDILPVMDKLNIVFQREDVNLATIRPMVKSTVASLDNLLQQTGENESEFINREMINNHFKGHAVTYCSQTHRDAHKQVRNEFISHLQENLRGRFPDGELSLVESMDQIFSPCRYPASERELAEYGNEALELLAEHYGKEKTVEDKVSPAVLNPDILKRDFLQMKHVVRNSGHVHFSNVCKALLTEYSEIFPEFATLASIAMILPVSSVPCERGFSCQNQIKTKGRNKLKEVCVNRLMTIRLEGPTLENFSPAYACELFRNQKERRK